MGNAINGVPATDGGNTTQVNTWERIGYTFAPFQTALLSFSSGDDLMSIGDKFLNSHLKNATDIEDGPINSTVVKAGGILPGLNVIGALVNIFAD